MHAPSIRAVVAAIARSLACAARVDSFHLYRLGCKDTRSERARAKEQESERARESKRARLRARENE